MDYFSGVEFLGFGGNEHYASWSTRNIKDYYTLQYAHTGYMHLGLDSDKNVQKYEAPFAWLMYKGRYFRFGNPDNTTWGHYYIMFRGARVDEFLRSGLYPIDMDPPVIRISNPAKFLNYILVLQEHLRYSSDKNDIAVHMLEGLLLQLHNQKTYKLGKHLSNRVHHLADKISKNPDSTWDFKRESAKMNISYSHFRSVFKDELGCPPHQFALRCKLRFAADMLRDKNKSIEEIASETGFNNIFYFNRLFKKYCRLPPSRYRKEIL